MVTLVLLGALAGCGKSGLPLVPVQGKITFAGSAPPAEGTITFMPKTVDSGLPRRPGRAHFDKEGTFRVTSFKDHDGLVPGTYDAKVTCWKGQPSSDDPSSFERLNHVPRNFQAGEVKVDANARSVEIAIDVPKKK